MSTSPRLPRPSPPLQPLVTRILTLGLALTAGIVAVGAVPQHAIIEVEAYAAIHAILEMCAVVVAMLIFTTGWIGAGRPQPVSSVILAGAYLSVALLDLLHLLSYAGMPPLVSPSGPEKAINFWLAARLVSGAALLQFVLFSSARPAGPRLRAAILAGNLLLTALLAWVGLWHPDWLPQTFIEGVGLTPLKVFLEFAIAAIFLCSASILLARRRLPEPFSVSSLLAGLVTLVASELCFSLYLEVNDGFNLLGHAYKVLADLFLYHALFVGAIREPYQQLATVLERLASERAALEVSEARFRALDTSVEEIIFTLDREGRHTDVFGRWLQRGGLDASHFLGRTTSEILGPEAAAVHDAASARALAGESLLYEWTAPGPGGPSFYQTSLAPLRDADGRITGVIGLGRDVTAQRQAEAALAMRNRELALLNRVIAASAASVVPEAILATVCRELALAFECPRAIALLAPSPGARARVVAVYPDGSPHPSEQELDALFVQARTSRAPVIQTEGPLQRLVLPVVLAPEHDEVPAIVILCALAPWPASAVQLAESVIRQTAGALARARLTEAHQLLSMAQEQTGESTMITDSDGLILAVNPAFERVSGYSQAEVMGKNPRLFKSGLHDNAFYQQLWGTLRRREIWRGRVINRHKDGSLYTLDTTIAPLCNAAGVITHYVAVRRDVTRELQLEAQFRQAQKMEAVGRLAGGIAHDFNNLLSVINGYSEFLLEAHPDPADPARGDVEMIRQAGERAAALTRQLLAFSRRQPLQPQVLDLNAVLGELELLMRRLIGEDVTVVMRPAPDLWPVAVDRGQLEQVVLNLAVNARDAMPQGGALTFTTSNVPHGGRGDSVRLEVADTGMGMRPETLEHLFEPFYTTKASGHGTGLGLATVYGIVTQSGGTIAVQSAPGQGARFTIDLPRHVDEASLAPPQPEPEPLPRGEGTILLVEDEAPIRTLAARVLRVQGYTVLTAPTADEAFQQYGAVEPVDLLLTDIVLSGMGGIALAQKLRARQPGLRVLLMSGYPDRADGGDLPNAPILLKPFTPATLVRAVRAALEQPASDTAAHQLEASTPLEAALGAAHLKASRASAPPEPEAAVEWSVDALRQANTALRWHLAAQAQTLHAREAVFQVLFRSTPIGVALVDLEGCVIEANEADARFLGYSPDELRGMHFSHFTHPDDVDLDTELFGELLSGARAAYTVDKRYVRKDGVTIWGHLTVALLRDRDGAPDSIVVTCEDITARQQGEAALGEGDEGWQLTRDAL